MTRRHTLIVVMAGLATMGALLAPTGRSTAPETIEPRRNTSYPPAHLAYSFTVEDYLHPDGTRGTQRLYYLIPTEESGHGPMLISYDGLLEHYRIDPAQLNRVPNRMPIRWLAKQLKRGAS